MKVKTSVTLSTELITNIDQWVGPGQNRSLFLEAAAWEHIARLRRKQRNLNDLQLINQHADELNEEAADALSFQIEL